MGVEDREWFKEERRERLRKAFERANQMNRRYQSVPPPHWGDRALVVSNKGVSGLALLLAAALLITPVIISKWPRIVQFFDTRMASTPPVLSEGLEPVPVQVLPPFPPSGTIRRHVPNDYSSPGLPLTVRNNFTEKNVVIRVRDWISQTPIATAYVSSGDEVRIILPRGKYGVLFADGKTWEGDEPLFGHQTVVSKGVEPVIIGAPGEAGQIIIMDGGYSGNFPIKPDRRSQF